MTSGEVPIRRQTTVRWDDADFTVRVVTMEDLIRIQRDDVANGWSRRWSSEEELSRQLSAGREMFLCPMVRNGGPEGSSESYRCWLWFTLGTGNGGKGVTLLDVGKDLYNSLPEVSSASDLKRVVRVMFGGVTEGCQFESIW
ncbi:hypothetical protein ACFWY9_12340 [Amycolatopsis sp. NPDC059027]|uniref:hypothetical protein n=1 Tax=Amycolatopsis sp. NPDC059027 TaxID=3346709 RepID=UPI00366AB4F4